MNKFESLNRYSFVMLALLGIFFLIAYIFLHYSFMRIDISCSQSTYLKLYWDTSETTTFTEKQSAWVRVNSRKSQYILPFRATLSDIKGFRLDLGSRKGVKIILRSLGFHGLGTSTTIIDTKDGFSKLAPNVNIENLNIFNSSMELTTSGIDPYLILDDVDSDHSPRFLHQLTTAFLLFLLYLLLIRTLPSLAKNYRFVPVALLVAGCLVFIMATLSKPNSHPDEFTHIDCATYYENHYSPPKVCSAESRHTYTQYGVSRLDKREVFYFLGGRYLDFAEFLPISDHLKLRYLNVFLFFIFVFLAFKSHAFRLLSLPLLITPQIWYLFSYFNSDAFSLFVVMITGYQIFEVDSALRRLLRNEQSRNTFIWIGGLALLVALQYWIKLNYFFYPLFLLLLGGSWLVTYGLPSAPKTSVFLLSIILIGTALFASWTYLRHYVNDFELRTNVAQCQETTASYTYKPSTPPDKQHPGFRLKDKGVSLHELLTERDWFMRIFYTGLGAYGYTEYLNSMGHYKIASISILTLFAYLSIVILISSNRFQKLALISALCMIVGVVIAAALNNWTTDFQPQGRYLLVIFPILGTLLYLSRRRLNSIYVFLLALLPISFAMYSFVYNGIVEITSK